MAKVLKPHQPLMLIIRPSKRSPLPRLFTSRDALLGNANPRWSDIQDELKRHGRHSCFFSDGRKQEQARKALESALGGKKTEFEKWNREIQKREEMGSGGASGGGWFGGRGWFSWFGGEHFWEEAQQAMLAILGIVSLYLLLAKGNVMFAVASNSLLFVLRGTRNLFALIPFGFPRGSSLVGSRPGARSKTDSEKYQNRMSAEESVVKKWRED